MSVNAHVAGGAGEGLVVFEGDVFAGVLVNILLGEAKIDHVNDAVPIVGLPTNQKVFRLYIAIDEVMRVHIFHALKLKKTTSPLG